MEILHEIVFDSYYRGYRAVGSAFLGLALLAAALAFMKGLGPYHPLTWGPTGALLLPGLGLTMMRKALVFDRMKKIVYFESGWGPFVATEQFELGETYFFRIVETHPPYREFGAEFHTPGGPHRLFVSTVYRDVEQRTKDLAHLFGIAAENWIDLDMMKLYKDPLARFPILVGDKLVGFLGERQDEFRTARGVWHPHPGPHGEEFVQVLAEHEGRGYYQVVLGRERGTVHHPPKDGRLTVEIMPGGFVD